MFEPARVLYPVDLKPCLFILGDSNGGVHLAPEEVLLFMLSYLKKMLP